MNIQFESTETRNYFLSIFSNYLCRNQKPLVALGQVPQYLGFLKAIGMPNHDSIHAQAFFVCNSFYNFSFEFNEFEDLKMQENIAQEMNADLLIIPCVRYGNNHARLLADGYIAVPSYIESRGTIDKSWQETHRENLNGKYLRNLLRNQKRVFETYDFKWSSLDKLSKNDSILQECAHVYELNAKKYQHPMNYYSLDILSELARWQHSDSLMIGRRFDKANNLAQVCFGFIDPRSQAFYYLAQGINHAITSQATNLYTASYCDIYAFMAQNGLKSLHMGRGMETEKRMLGANQFILLYNYLKPLNDFWDTRFQEIHQNSKIIRDKYLQLTTALSKNVVNA